MRAIRKRPATAVAITGALLLAVLVPGAGSSASALTATTTTLRSSADPTAGVAVTLTARVAPVPGGGTVDFTADGGDIYGCSSVSVSGGGSATCTTTFSGTGQVAVAAAYSGGGSYAASKGKRTITVAARTPDFVGNTGACTTAKGALVAVDFGPWSGPIVRGCDPKPTTGITLLTTAKFTTEGDQHDGPQFICRIGNPLFDSGKQYPTAAQDACVTTPPAAAYWSFWLAKKGTDTWTYSTLGVYSDKPRNGEVEAWVYGGTDVAGTSGQPTFTPDDVRAGLAPSKPAATAASTSTATPDLASAVGYLTDPANLIGGTHYEPFGGGFVDYGLTMDGALALAAAGTADTTLRKITAYVAANADGYTGIGTQYASGGSIGKEALLAEVTGNDPTNFGGHDLIAVLDKVVCSGANSKKGCAGKGNYAYAQSTFSQSLGVLAQLRAGDTSGAAAPVAFLEGLQSSSGAFPSVIPGNDSEVDSTAMAAMALALVPGASADVQKAVSWIVDQQEPDGGFPGASGDSVNSAALALQGLTLEGTTYDDQIAKGLTFLAGEQNDNGGFDVAVGSEGSDLRASTQALGGAIGTPFGTLTDDVAGRPTAHADADAASAWLVGQLAHRTHLNYAGGYGPNYGGTADVAFALVATGNENKALGRVANYVVGHTAEYADPDGTGKYPGPYSGAVAKVALLAEVFRSDPAHLDGFNLIKTLVDHVCKAADTTGACTARGDFFQAYSTVSQALGVLALARDGVSPPKAAVTRLEQLQCPDGGFSSSLIAPGATCTSDVDTTGFAIQALVLVPSAADDVSNAVTYLRAAQEGDGGWPGAAGDNTDSAALAVQGLLAAPASADAATRPAATLSDPAVKQAQTFFAARQNPDGGLGITASSPASDTEASAQAIPAIVGTPLTTLVIPIHMASGGHSSGGPKKPPHPVGSGGPAGHDDGGGSLANTGVRTSELLAYALVLLVCGGALCVGARRRVQARHRPVG